MVAWDPYLGWLEEAELSALPLYALARARDVSTWRRAGSYVNRLFKGAKPAELPVEQVDQFRRMINQKSARHGFASWLGSLAPHTVFVANHYDEVFARIAAEILMVRISHRTR